MVLKRNELIKLYSFKSKAKLQTTPLKFGDIWISHLEVPDFRFYPLKFGNVWILHPEISNFRFYPLKFGVLEFYTLKFQNFDFTI